MSHYECENYLVTNLTDICSVHLDMTQTKRQKPQRICDHSIITIYLQPANKIICTLSIVIESVKPQEILPKILTVP